MDTREGDTFEGRYLIGSDGAGLVVAQSLGLRQGKTLAAAIEAEAPVSSEVMRRFANEPLFIFGETRLGYLWIIPKADHQLVGIGALHPRPGELQANLKRVMARYDISLEGIALHGNPLPIFSRKVTIATPCMLLAGDAAGLVDPFSGEGIRFAIKSGRMAADAILSGNLARYPRRVYREIGVNHMVASSLALICYHTPRACFARGVRNPFATQAFVDLPSERASYSEVVLHLYGSLPIFLLIGSIASAAGGLRKPLIQ